VASSSWSVTVPPIDKGGYDYVRQPDIVII
jgi:hypothetical protein